MNAFVCTGRFYLARKGMRDHEVARGARQGTWSVDTLECTVHLA